MEVRIIHPLKGEPLTVLVMPNIIVSERMFGVNDTGRCIVYTCTLYCILYLVLIQYIVDDYLQ